MEEQVVTFQLAGELYGVEVGRVQSIIPMQPITVVPGAPRFIEGVINLRGSVVPVIDLGARFALPMPEARQKRVIVIMELDQQQVGLIVDRVTSVMRLDASTVEPPSPLLTSVETAYLRGIARLGQQQVMILLDVDRVFSMEEQQALQQAG
jgi:purine-binding chemotaxis protein CheW